MTRRDVRRTSLTTAPTEGQCLIVKYLVVSGAADVLGDVPQNRVGDGVLSAFDDRNKIRAAASR
jgi:hypothetical protein